jgi:hypothetical protein
MNYEKNLIGKKFEFLLLINGNIICQRYFNIREFNPNVLHSYELKSLVDRCVNYITGEHQGKMPSEWTLRGKTWKYLWAGFNPYLDEYPPCEVKNNYEDEDIFTFQIRINGRVVIEKMFSGNDYPPKVRYDVDIRGVIPEIIADIQETMAEKYLHTV